MPMKRELYPDDWEKIAESVKWAAGWRCVECGQTCRMSGESLGAFKDRLREEAENDKEGLYLLALDEILAEVDAHPQRYTLTVAHLNHEPSDCREENLRAWCAPCHLRYDADHHGEARREGERLKRIAGGQLTLGDELDPRGNGPAEETLGARI